MSVQDVELAVPPRLRGVAPVGRERDLLQYFYMCGLWTLTTYSACDLRCSYCVSYAQGRSEPRWSASDVVERLRGELDRIPPDAPIAVGSLIDGYPRAEAAHGVTRLAIEELVRRRRRLIIVTKGTTILRDADLLADRPEVSVLVSLPSLDDDALHDIEPGVASATDRIALVRSLAAAGVDVELHVQPWIPEVTDAEAMIDLMQGVARVCFGPLNVQLPTLVGTPLARRFDQRAINEAYVAEQRRIGPRPAVSWQEPVWLEHDLDGGRSDPRRASSASRPEHEPEPEERNTATIRRLVETFDDGTFPLIALEVLSPHIVGHDLTGRLSDPAYPDSGQFLDLVGVAAAALEDARFELRSIEAEGDEVHAHIVARGRATGSLLGWDGDGSEVTLETRTTYRFDRNGLIVELWQHAVSLPASCR